MEELQWEVTGKSRLSALLPDRRQGRFQYAKTMVLGSGQLLDGEVLKQVVRANRPGAGRRASGDARTQDAHRHDRRRDADPVSRATRGSAKTSRRFCVEKVERARSAGVTAPTTFRNDATKHRTAAARESRTFSRRPIARRDAPLRSLRKPYGRLLAITRRVLRHAAQTVKGARRRWQNLSGRARRGVKTMEKMIELGGRASSRRPSSAYSKA